MKKRLRCDVKRFPRVTGDMLRNAMDTDYGWKRVCADFEGHNARDNPPSVSDGRVD